MVVQNPVSPFLNRVFPNPYVHVDFEDEMSSRIGDKTPGVLGPVFLLAPFLC